MTMDSFKFIAFLVLMIAEANARIPFKANARIPFEANAMIAEENAQIPFEANARIPFKANARIPFEANSRIPIEENAQLWGIGSSNPVDCSVTMWTRWSTPFFAGTATRTRSVLRTPMNGGKGCPPVLETKNTGTQMTTKQVADSVTNNFLFQTKVGNSRLNRKTTYAKRRDLLVILDASGSIGSGGFSLAVQQIAELLGFLCPQTRPFDNHAHKLAVIRYSSTATEIFDFNAYSSTQSTLSAVRSITYTGGGTNTAAAFKLAKNMLVRTKGARLDEVDVKQEVLILTDGHSNNKGQSIAAARALKEEADVFGLVIGNITIAGKDEILEYVSYPPQNHLFSLPSFRDLTRLVNYIRASVVSHKCAPFDLNRTG